MKKYIKIIWCLSICCLCITLAGCSVNASNNDNKLTVAVSIVPQKTFVEAVAGDLVNIVTLIPPGYSPANYQPSPGIIKDFSKSSIYFSIGVPTEETNILPKANALNMRMKIVHLADKVGEIYPHRYFKDEHNNGKNDTEHFHSPKERDPHIWLSPKRVMVMIDTIAEELSYMDNKNSSFYTENAASYKNKLEALDKSIKESLEGLENKAFIVYHPSFGYFADDYGLEMLSLENNGKKATAGNMQKMIDTAKNNNIKVVFYQAEIDSRQSKTFAEEIGGKAEQIIPLAPNYVENLQKTAEVFASTLIQN